MPDQPAAGLLALAAEQAAQTVEELVGDGRLRGVDIRAGLARSAIGAVFQGVLVFSSLVPSPRLRVREFNYNTDFMRHLAWRTVRLLVVCFLAALPSPRLDLLGSPEGVRIWVGNQHREVDTRQHQGRVYYRLRDLASILKLEIKESGQQIVVSGPRGLLSLVDGRPLVGIGGQYLLLSSAAWKRKSKDWYVPEDFLVKVLPNLLRDRLEKRTDGAYRLVPLDENGVWVEVENYPDHVSVIFQPEQSVPIEVREFRDYLEVEFGEKLVRPQMKVLRPDARLVSDVQYNSFHAFGSFRVLKGRAFTHFRSNQLSDPFRMVVDVYGDSLLTAASIAPTAEAAATTSAPSSEESLSKAPAIPARDVVGGLRSRPPDSMIVLDPGHGGDDSGVRSEGELVEKNLALSLARRIKRLLAGRGFEVQLTRTRDVKLDAELRSSVANFYNSALFVSFHFGGSPSDTIRGPVVYLHSYPPGPTSTEDVGSGPVRTAALSDASRLAPDSQQYDKLVPWEEGQRDRLPESRRLAEELQRELNRLFGTANSTVEAPLAVLAPVTAPALLIEAGFLSQPQDQQLLADSQFQERLAETVAEVLARFLK